MTSPGVAYLPRHYEWVVLNVVFNWIVITWQAVRLYPVRKEYKVEYPTLYEGKENSVYNRYQRAHQNSLEWNPGFLVFLLLGGLSCPLSSAFAGVIYNVGRIVYALGYYEGNPHNKGLYGLYGLLFLAGTTCYTAYQIATRSM